ncbi:MAG: hydrogenase iron-sulfur subunit [Methanomassiliicoccales archaeon]|nr:hydrogenase iron-sulfur subunit [Methanomassiliicoccales archaeon]NYT14932.1 hydrogenase iron-sulfur subunit [Methanomassiliicoccales archaeon]
MDIDALSNDVARWEDVYVDDELFLCSESGQEKIRRSIDEQGLDKVVIAACSPGHHYHVFRDCIGERINPFLWEFVNIREQCSWVHKGKEATEKALALIKGGVEKTRLLDPIGTVKVPVSKDILVVGGGIAGIQAAIELDSKEHRVYLIEKEPSIGGNMVKLDKTFPTEDCSMCTISPKLSDVARRKNVELLTYSEVEEVSGRPGEYHVKIRRKPRFVDEKRCTGCGACDQTSYEKLVVPNGIEIVDRLSIDRELCTNCGACAKICAKAGHEAMKKGEDLPSYDSSHCVGCFKCVEKCPKDAITIINACPVRVSSEFDHGIGSRAAIYVPFAQALPATRTRDPVNCLRLNGTMPDCVGCETICPADAIVHEDEESFVEVTVGAIIVATGYELKDMSGTEYNLAHPDVITGLQLERLLNASGPTGGELRRPSNGLLPTTVTFIQCVGSRDLRYNPYCSKICCMYAIKQARLIKQRWPQVDVNICYMDLRAAGRWYEEYYKTVREMGVTFIRGNAADVLDNEENNIVRVEDTLDLERKIQLIESDLVVLSVSMNPSKGTLDIAKILGAKMGEDSFLNPLHPKIEPVDTVLDGIFIAGTCSGPKPIQESIAEANAVASRASTFLHNDEMEVDLTTACIDPLVCIGCEVCKEGCNYSAVMKEEDKFTVGEISCKSCGKCVSSCPSGALQLRGLTDDQIEAQIKGILEQAPGSIVALCCQHCSYNAADLAGLAKRKYTSKVKIIRTPCTGRISMNHILTAFVNGASGVMVAGCMEDDCHYVDGNYAAKEKVKKIREMLELMGISGERVEMFNMSSSMGGRWIECVNEMEGRCQ